MHQGMSWKPEFKEGFKAKDQGDIGREGIKDVVKDTPVPVLGQVHSGAFRINGKN
jgi:hypothetical protein